MSKFIPTIQGLKSDSDRPCHPGEAILLGRRFTKVAIARFLSKTTLKTYKSDKLLETISR
ncbi:hypothetical protein JJD41_15150 [Oxynema sp. CENA135]|uniref:hypothetical protein n=1 Tax=Oxynema sp. CENA135 TaxID=984206 RepID=UPI001A4C6919|nr:hypothetical protein [Oxynema sp. CENA135]MBK4731188.1 hypothetical protein [Oxynema sp. CENA135]